MREKLKSTEVHIDENSAYIMIKMSPKEKKEMFFWQLADMDVSW